MNVKVGDLITLPGARTQWMVFPTMACVAGTGRDTTTNEKIRPELVVEVVYIINMTVRLWIPSIQMYTYTYWTDTTCKPFGAKTIVKS